MYQATIATRNMGPAPQWEKYAKTPRDRSIDIFHRDVKSPLLKSIRACQQLILFNCLVVTLEMQRKPTYCRISLINGMLHELWDLGHVCLLKYLRVNDRQQEADYK